ncbi:MAG: hypothetical protein H7296_07605 [Bacteroidia bacterium]|nr:hypothetical protein [Bacteroidia bacterium]
MKFFSLIAITTIFLLFISAKPILITKNLKPENASLNKKSLPTACTWRFDVDNSSGQAVITQENISWGTTTLPTSYDLISGYSPLQNVAYSPTAMAYPVTVKITWSTPIQGSLKLYTNSDNHLIGTSLTNGTTLSAQVVGNNGAGSNYCQGVRVVVFDGH